MVTSTLKAQLDRILAQLDSLEDEQTRLADFYASRLAQITEQYQGMLHKQASQRMFCPGPIRDLEEHAPYNNPYSGYCERCDQYYLGNLRNHLPKTGSVLSPFGESGVILIGSQSHQDDRETALREEVEQDVHTTNSVKKASQDERRHVGEYNPNHDAAGRFASGDDGGGSSFDALSAHEKDAALTQAGSAWRQSLSESERNAISDYADGSFMAMNDALRKGEYGGIPANDFARFAHDEPQIAASMKNSTDEKNALAARALLRGATPTDMTVHRYITDIPGVDMFSTFASNVGKHYVDRGFFSTSLSDVPDVAHIHTLMHISLPKGSPGGYMGPIAPYENSDEWTMPPNGKFHIDHVETSAQGEKHVYLTYAGQHGE